MRTVTSALALSVFVSFFVWISALSMADHQNTLATPMQDDLS